MAYRTSPAGTTWPNLYDPEFTTRHLRMSARQLHQDYGVAETMLLHGLNRTTMFFIELLDAPGIGEWSLSKWMKACQRRKEADRIIRALL